MMSFTAMHILSSLVSSSAPGMGASPKTLRSVIYGGPIDSPLDGLLGGLLWLLGLRLEPWW